MSQELPLIGWQLLHLQILKVIRQSLFRCLTLTLLAY